MNFIKDVYNDCSDIGTSMIDFTSGDIFSLDVDIRVNTVNCKGVMGAGVALAFKHKYPEMFRDYQRACAIGEVRPGKMHIWKNLMGDWIINFPTKRDWRQKSSYEDIAAGLKDLRIYLDTLGPVRVALPALGCGNGGLDWNKVAPMIQDELQGTDAHIFVFSPTDSQRAGKKAADELTDDELRELAEFNYIPVDLPERLSGSAIPIRGFARGNSDLINRDWIGIIFSANPSEKEMLALAAIAKELSLDFPDQPVGLIYQGKATLPVIKLFIDAGIQAVVILPFGPLDKQSDALYASEIHNKLASISLGGKNEHWSRKLVSRANLVLHRGADAVVISDPNPGWLLAQRKTFPDLQKLYYLKYREVPEKLAAELGSLGVRAIGRRAETGAPNLTPLLKNAGAGDLNTVEFLTPNQLRNVADVLDNIPMSHFELKIGIVTGNLPDDIANELKRILH